MALTLYQFSPTGYYASFKVNRNGSAKLPVVAWDDDGEPLVVRKGSLVRADSRDGLIGVYQCGTQGVVIPADPGWTVRYVPEKDTGTGVSTTLPIVAWRINEAEGLAVPVTVEHDADWPDGECDMKIDRIIAPAGAYPPLGLHDPARVQEETREAAEDPFQDHAAARYAAETKDGSTL
jgi:hypothetical protein